MEGDFIIILFVAAIFLATPVAVRICDERRSRKAIERHYAPPPREDANKAIQDAASARLLKGRADELAGRRRFESLFSSREACREFERYCLCEQEAIQGI